MGLTEKPRFARLWGAFFQTRTGDHVSELTLAVSGELEDVFGGSERAVAVVIQPCVPVLVIGSLHADTMLDCTESSSPGETSTRWRPAVLAGMQAVMLLTAATLGVFKGSA